MAVTAFFTPSLQPQRDNQHLLLKIKVLADQVRILRLFPNFGLEQMDGAHSLPAWRCFLIKSATWVKQMGSCHFFSSQRYF
jgi:hypothetical protein